MTQSNQKGPIEAVREGMTVRDAGGADIGTVSLVKMSDPGVVTGEGQEPEAAAQAASTSTGPNADPVVPVVGIGAGAGGPGATGGAGGMGTPYAGAPFGLLATGTFDAPEPDVPEEFRDRLIRTGYLKIDSKGLFRRDVYVSADQLDRVGDDDVFLNTTKDHLIKED